MPQVHRVWLANIDLFPDRTPDCSTVHTVCPNRQFLPSQVRSFIDCPVARWT
jgi:hypothetical protein